MRLALLVSLLATALLACGACRSRAACVPGAAPGPDSLAGATLEPRPLAAFPAPGVRAWQVGLLRPDRFEHASLSFAIAAALTVAWRDRAAAAGATLALGAAKELWDSRHGSADAVDLVANVAGISVSVLTIRGRAP